jgi:hypothetical protein
MLRVQVPDRDKEWTRLVISFLFIAFVPKHELLMTEVIKKPGILEKWLGEVLRKRKSSIFQPVKFTYTF